MTCKFFVALALVGLLIVPARAATVMVGDDDTEVLSKKLDLYLGINFSGGNESPFAVDGLVSGEFAKGLRSSELSAPRPATDSTNFSGAVRGASGSAHSKFSLDRLGLSFDHQFAGNGDGRDISSSVTDPGSSLSTQTPATTSDSVAGTPLPSALPLFATGLAAIGLFGWWRKRKARSAI
jgi:hypothetical protein